MDGTRIAINQAVVFPVAILTDAAESPFSLCHAALSWAEFTANLATLQGSEEGRELGFYEPFLYSLRLRPLWEAKEMTCGEGTETGSTKM